MDSRNCQTFPVSRQSRGITWLIYSVLKNSHVRSSLISQQTPDQAWNKSVLPQRYVFAVFDAINRGFRINGHGGNGHPGMMKDVFP
jgi:ABC-type antimicrobial peptide transport system permease subunit